MKAMILNEVCEIKVPGRAPRGDGIVKEEPL